MSGNVNLSSAMSPDEVRIIAIRHGEGERNHRGTNIQGWVDDEASYLNETGKRQADTVGRAIAEYYPDIAAFYTSDLHRCIQTTERFVVSYFEVLDKNEKCDDLSACYTKIPEFREINHGIYDTMSYKKRNEFCNQYYLDKLSTGEGRQELIEKFRAAYPESVKLEVIKNDPFIELGSLEASEVAELEEAVAARFIKWGYNPMQEIPLAEAGREPEYTKEPTQKDLPETIMDVYLRASKKLAEIAAACQEGQTVAFIAHAGVIKTLATEAESRQNGNINTPLPTYYEPALPGSKITSGNCSCQVFYYNKMTGELRFEGSQDFSKVAQKV